MATVNYRLRKVKQDKYPVLVYLSLGRGNIIQVKTGFTIHPNDWSLTTKRPKQNSSFNKALFNNLLKLETYIFNLLNESNASGGVINRYWLESAINNCFDRLDKSDLVNNLLTFQTKHIIANANTRIVRGSNRVGLSNNTIKGYNTFLNIIKNYEDRIKKEIRLTDVNSVFVENFTEWLMNEQDYSVNHTGKQISLLKTVCLDAQKREIKTNQFINQIKSFSESKEDRFIITLSFEELEQIRLTNITKESLINTRKWLLLGCEIGQRGNDLLSLNKDNIRFSNNNMLLDVYQQKTGKTVTIPITKNYIEKFLKEEFPRKISIQKLNEYLKELCEFSRITERVKGSKLDSLTQRKKLGLYPKYELISSHIFRRSFATNYYKLIPTPILIEITGHSKEGLFLKYIGKPKDKDENANLFLKLVKEMNKEKESNLKAI